MTADTDPSLTAPPATTLGPVPDVAGAPSIFGAPRIAPHHLRRPRLRAVLDREPQAALIVVQAGSGFGKSSLLAEWATSRPVAAGPVLWVTADDSVQDTLAFWREVLHALDTAGLVQTTAFRHVEVRGDIADALLPSLRRGFASLATPVTLIVDGFERLAGTPVEDDLIDLLERTDTLRLVIATHTPSKITAPSTAAAIDTVIIDARDLRFTADEVVDVARAAGARTTPTELRRLTESLDGWPFGVRAVLEYQRRAHAESAAHPATAVFGIPLTDPEPLDVGFIHRHLLESLDGVEGVDALEVTTVLDAFSLEQAAWLGAFDHEHPVLAELESRGLGTWHGDATARTFRIHPVLRTALRGRFEARPAAAATAYARLAEWYIARADFARGFETAILAGEWETAVRCLRTDLFAVLLRLRLHPMLMDQVPRRVFRSEPLMMLVDGVAVYGRGNQARALRTFVGAIAACERERLTTKGAPTPEQVWVQGVLAAALRLSGRYELVPSAFRRFVRMLDGVDDPEGELDRSMSLFRSQQIVTLSLLDKLDDAEQLALTAIDEDHPMSSLQRASLHGLVAFAHARRGNVLLAAEVLTAVDPTEIPEQFDPSFFAVTQHIANALVAIERFDPETAIGCLDLTNAHWRTMEYWPFALDARVRAEWQLRGPHIALQVLREARAQKTHKASVGPAMTMMLTAVEAELLLAAAGAADAAALLTSARVRRFPRLAVPKSRALLSSGKLEQAAALAHKHAHDPVLSWSARADLLLIAASADLRRGDEASARASFARACEIAAGTGIRTVFAGMPREDLAALATDAPEFVAALLNRPAAYPVPATTVSLSPREQVVLRELAGDATIPDIARALNVSTNTLKSQVRSIYRKLEASSRDEAIQAARQQGLLMSHARVEHTGAP